MVDISPCLYGYMLDRAQEKAVLVHILYLHKKTRFLNILCTGYEYFKDSSVLYLDISCFNLIVAFSNMKYNNKKKKKMEKSELSQSVENHENISVML